MKKAQELDINPLHNKSTLEATAEEFGMSIPETVDRLGAALLERMTSGPSSARTTISAAPREVEPHKRFGLSVRTHRRDLGLTTDELGETSGLGGTEIEQVEAGEVWVSLRGVARLTMGLGLRPRQLCEEMAAYWLAAADLFESKPDQVPLQPEEAK